MYKELAPRKFYFIDLLTEFVKTDFRLRYKGSILGFIWIIIKPFALYSILYIVWSSVFKTVEGGKLFLFLGIILNTFFNDGINMGLLALTNKANIILKINFPREIVLVSSTLVALINFIINLGVVAIFALLNPTDISLTGLLLFVCSIVTLYLLIVGSSYFLSIFNIIFRDIRHIVELVLQVLFWVTPILYHIEQLPLQFQKIVLLNPLTHVFLAARAGILDSSHITYTYWQGLLWVFVLAMLLNITGYYYFSARVRKIAEYF
ncbi:ABC transporter permease [bacterium]|nr:ABC transporter permease [bacterium]